MAEAGTFCINADVKRKAGEGASTTSSAEAYTNDFITQVESYINCLVRYNFTDNYVALNDDVKFILKEATSNMAAMYVILYDTSGYRSVSATENMLNVLWVRFKQCIILLQDQKTTTYIQGA